MEKTCMEWRFVPRKPITCSGVIETQNDDDGTCIKKDPGKQFVTTHLKNKYQVQQNSWNVVQTFLQLKHNYKIDRQECCSQQVKRSRMLQFGFVFFHTLRMITVKNIQNIAIITPSKAMMETQKRRLK